jgi:4-hydroxybenzoate polyprenyltransferase
MSIKDRLPDFIALMRFDKPIGTLLLLWPTLTALWFAAQGQPETKILAIFICGVTLMRAAGCVINDYADRHWDGEVARTQNRPIVQGRITDKEALILFCALCAFSFALVLLTNWQTICLSFIAVILAALYPFTKRFTYFPQLFLGAAFSMGIPMAFSAVSGTVPQEAWLLFLFNWVWTVAYDTQYAMVDREDDIKAGIKSIALFFDRYDRYAVACLQAISLFPLILLASRFDLGFTFISALLGICGLFVYQFKLTVQRDPQCCFKAFLNNAWLGALLYVGTVTHFWLAG